MTALDWPLNELVPVEPWDLLHTGLPAPSDGADARSAAGTLGVELSITGTSRKKAASSASLALDLATSPEQEKGGVTSGDVEAVVEIDGIGVKTLGVSGSVSIEVALVALALAERVAAGDLDVELDVGGSAVKGGDAAGALALAFDLAGDASKAVSVAGALGLVLDIEGTTGAVSGTLALTLALLATATKMVEVDGALGLTLEVDGVGAKSIASAGSLALELVVSGAVSKTGVSVGSIGVELDADGTADPGAPRGFIGVTLAVSGTATKSAGAVGLLSLLVAVAGISGRFVSQGDLVRIPVTVTVGGVRAHFDRLVYTHTAAGLQVTAVLAPSIVEVVTPAVSVVAADVSVTVIDNTPPVVVT